MESESAEIARAETAAVVDDGMFNFLDSRNAAAFFVGRMIITHIWQSIDLVQLLCFKRNGRLLLNEIEPFFLLLNDDMTSYMVLLLLNHIGKLGILTLFSCNFIEGWDRDNIVACWRSICQKCCAADVCHIRWLLLALETVCDFNDGCFAHTEAEHICSRLNKDGWQNCILPVVIVGETAK